MESDIYVEECLACPQQLFTALQQTENEKSASFVDGYFTLKCFNRDTREGFHISFTSWMCFLYLFIHRLAILHEQHTHTKEIREMVSDKSNLLCVCGVPVDYVPLPQGRANKLNHQNSHCPYRESTGIQTPAHDGNRPVRSLAGPVSAVCPGGHGWVDKDTKLSRSFWPLPKDSLSQPKFVWIFQMNQRSNVTSHPM